MLPERKRIYIKKRTGMSLFALLPATAQKQKMPSPQRGDGTMETRLTLPKGSDTVILSISYLWGKCNPRDGNPRPSG